MPILVGARFTRSLGLGPGLERSEVVRGLRALAERHRAVMGLIRALEAAAAAGCDLRYFQCLGCERLAAGRPASGRRKVG